MRRLDMWIETETIEAAASLHDALRNAAIACVRHDARSVHVPARGNAPFDRADVLEVVGEWSLGASRPDVRIAMGALAR
jgi:hypothetical protein